VVLQHGLGANRWAFTLPEVSLASHLAQRGYDCYVPELRGAGRSEAPRAGWTIDDYLEQDVPAIVRAVQDQSGHAQLGWVGHSMGGVLMLMYGIENAQAPISRMVAVGSALDYRCSPNIYQRLRHVRPLLGRLQTLPFGWISLAAARVAGVGPILLTESINFHRPNVERSVCRKLMAEGFAPIPMRLFDSLATTFSAQGFSRAQGRIVYLPRAHELRIPTLVIAGSRDAQCPPEMARNTYERIGSPIKQLRTFGTGLGHASDYGHFDLLVGRHAPAEVWPAIAEFLDAEHASVDVCERAMDQ
jgi:pimeloyl-ACP methyl ester carboxylesterase